MNDVSRYPGETSTTPVVIPIEAYTSEAYARAENDKLWGKVWQAAARVEEIPNVGDYVTYDIMDESIIIVRTAADRIQAFYNVCQHRGRQRAAVTHQDQRGLAMLVVVVMRFFIGMVLVVHLPDRGEIGQHQAVQHAAGVGQHAHHFELMIAMLAAAGTQAVAAGKPVTEAQAARSRDLGAQYGLHGLGPHRALRDAGAVQSAHVPPRAAHPPRPLAVLVAERPGGRGEFEQSQGVSPGLVRHGRKDPAGKVGEAPGQQPQGVRVVQRRDLELRQTGGGKGLAGFRPLRSEQPDTAAELRFLRSQRACRGGETAMVDRLDEIIEVVEVLHCPFNGTLSPKSQSTAPIDAILLSHATGAFPSGGAGDEP